MSDESGNSRVFMFRLIPTLLLVAFVGWCTSSRHAQQDVMPVYTELVELFTTEGLVDQPNGRVDLNAIAKRQGESTMNRLLYQSAATGTLPALKWLIQHGADPKNVGAMEGATLLQRVAKHPSYDRLAYFINDLNLNPLERGPGGMTLLHVAAQAGVDDAALRFLLSKGLKVGDTTLMGRQPIHYASIKSIGPLVAAGADINAIDDKGRTALHWAAEESRQDAVTELLRLGASVFTTDKHGSTPLHLAAIKPTETLVDALLAAGAPKTARDANNLTPRDVYLKSSESRWRSEQSERLLGKL